MTSAEKKQAKRGPESAFWDTLKGHDVVIDLHEGKEPNALRAKLLWVDRYTIGVRVPGTGKERMINKKFIRGIERDESNATGVSRATA